MNSGDIGLGSQCPCVVCDFHIEVSASQTPIRTIDDITEISGRPLKDLLGGLFTQDYELLVKLERRPKRSSGTLHVCEVCFALLEQIDAFEHNLTKLRLDLTARRENAANANARISSGQGCDENGSGSFPELADVVAMNDGRDCLEDVLKTIKQVRILFFSKILFKVMIIITQTP